MKPGENEARIARAKFIALRDRVLQLVAGERLTVAQAMLKLEREYSKRTQAFLRVPPATYGQWLALGPREVLEELREARSRDWLWDRLVDQACERRAWAGRRAA